MVTVKEIANKYKVSKQTVFFHIKKLSNDCYQIDDKGTYRITEKGQQILDEILSKKPSKDTVNFDIKALTAEVSRLTAELDRKNDEIMRLLSALDQEQKLHLLAEQKILQLEDKSNKKKWWHFFSKSSD